jgi:hypothetical protein
MGNIDLEQAAPEGIAYQLIVNSLEMRAKNHVRFNEDDDDDDCDVLQPAGVGQQVPVVY